MQWVAAIFNVFEKVHILGDFQYYKGRKGIFHDSRELISCCRAQSFELLTRICDFNPDFASWIKSQSPFCDQKYPTSPTYFFFYIGFDLQKIVIKMADLSKQRFTRLVNDSAFGFSLQPRSEVKTVLKQKILQSLSKTFRDSLFINGWRNLYG